MSLCSSRPVSIVQDYTVTNSISHKFLVLYLECSCRVFTSQSDGKTAGAVMEDGCCDSVLSMDC